MRDIEEIGNAIMALGTLQDSPAISETTKANVRQFKKELEAELRRLLGERGGRAPGT